jgi:hypothetical protein
VVLPIEKLTLVSTCKKFRASPVRATGSQALGGRLEIFRPLDQRRTDISCLTKLLDRMIEHV